MSEFAIKLHSLHPAQKQIMAEHKRFNVLKCGRRFGKTELTKELAIQPLLDGKFVGMWNASYKDLADVWTELLFTLHDVIRSKSEQLKSLTLITGGKLDMWSLDDSNSGRGRKYHRAIIDEAEKCRHLKDGWEQTIRATLVDYQGDAWFMSTPKFGETYFKKIFKNEEKFKDWKSWRFTSYDNPFLKKEEIEQTKAQLDELVFRCEFMAEDVDINNSPWAWAFNKEKHIEMVTPDPKNYLYLSFDFNRNPITCSVIQHIDLEIRVLEQLKLSNSNIYELCNRIKALYPNYLYVITGDATGRSSSALVKDSLNYYIIIKQSLQLMDGQIRVPSVNPRLEENQVLVNSLLSNYKVKIHPQKAEALIYDLQNVKTFPDGSIIKTDRSDPTQQADSLDCFRYYCNQFHRQFIKEI